MNKLKPEDKAIILSILFGVGFWIIDILLDNQLFYSSESIPSEVLNQIHAHEIYIRSFVLSLFLIFGLILARVLKSRRSLLENAERSKEELHTMLYSIGDAVIATDNRDAITHMNPQAEKITGWDLSDARGLPLKKIFNIINEKTRQPIESPADIVLREGRRVNLANHTVLIAKNGREVSIADSGSPIFDNEKKIIGVVLVFRDVTEERRRRNLIFDREARYRGIISHTTDGIFLSDQEGKILEWNRGNEEITGLSRNDVIGKHFCEIFIKFVPPEKRTPEYQREIQERFSKIRKDVQNGLREYTTEVELHMPDGSIKYIEQSIFLIPRKGGNWFGNISTDITRAKLREKEIRQSEEKFSKTFALSPDAIVISRLSDGMIIECNQGFIAEYGAPREVIIGRTSKEIRLWKNPADRE
ncbi:MAG: PAS domain S-box protein, partial [Bacteroidota bacterium]